MPVLDHGHKQHFAEHSIGVFCLIYANGYALCSCELRYNLKVCAFTKERSPPMQLAVFRGFIHPVFEKNENSVVSI